ncbi:MAG: HIT family protein [Saprospiraceae bacterium]|jgi:histidine triad (HIT) family protein|nr:HIT family protein [Saprospiraceae bacterium]MBK7796087.1 HIT family protein [Saprospiraceae bacterium]MBK8151730.1 HIT family protein [Saprospiraceae bacterium]MBK9378080.1 HIT family protein [Saprospiraceae bacterium]MBL0261171.1 HIT family protein [Saprospiraceae bacterium]
MPTIFTRIIQGEIPCHKIAETSNCFAFLDIRPLAKGHTLVIPKTEVDYFFDLPPEIIHEIMDLSRKIAVAIKEVVPCTKVGISVIGLEVPHAHLHLVPITAIGDMNFSKEKMSLSDKEMAELATQIRSRIS